MSELLSLMRERERKREEMFSGFMQAITRRQTHTEGEEEREDGDTRAGKREQRLATKASGKRCYVTARLTGTAAHLLLSLSLSLSCFHCSW